MDQIALNYSSSDSDSETNALQEDTLPELPDEVLDKYHLAPSSKMNSRVRGFNSFVYLEWRPSKMQRMYLTRLLMDFQAQCRRSGVNILQGLKLEPLQVNALGSPEPLHVSLSRNLEFENQFQRNAFQDLLGSRLSSYHLDPIEIEFESKFQVLDSRFKDRVFLTLPVASHQRSHWFKAAYQVLWDSLAEVWPHCSDAQIVSMLCPPESVHMSIAQAYGITASEIAIWIESVEPLEPLPRWKATDLKLDKNRESIKLPL